MIELEPTLRPELDAADRLRATLWARVKRVLDRQTNGTRRIVRVAVPVDGALDLVDWLDAQAVGDATYWSGRGSERAVAAAGAADVVATRDLPIDYDALQADLQERLTAVQTVRPDGSAWQDDAADAPSGDGYAAGDADAVNAVESRLSPAPVRFYGGLRFDARQSGTDARPSRPWAAFGTARFVLPRFTLEQIGDRTTLTCTLVLPRDAGREAALKASIDGLAFPTPRPPEPIDAPASRTDAPEPERWEEMVNWALDAFAENRLQKVVLARQVTLAFNSRPDPLAVLRHLERATPGCFHFAVRPSNGPVFLGASPERLFRQDGRRVRTEAVAGTRSRGESAEADAELRDELLESEKDRREHAFVADAIRNRLSTLCRELDGGHDASELTLTRGRHLRSRFDGTLHPDVSPIDVLSALHPTPAVGGTPRPEALAAIREQEPFDRGWYAGPVGWIGRDSAEFTVAIRSGLVHPGRIDLFSGAGIVQGSDPEREWKEIEQKLGDFAAVLGLGD